MVRYYVRMSDWTNCPRGEYHIDLYEDEGFEGKQDFYRKCIAQTSDDDQWGKEKEFDFGELQEEICIIEIEVDNRIRVYYFDGLDDTVGKTDIDITPTHFLGYVDHFLDAEDNPNIAGLNELATYVVDKIKPFPSSVSRYILTISENKFELINIDNEFFYLG